MASSIIPVVKLDFILDDHRQGNHTKMLCLLEEEERDLSFGHFDSFIPAVSGQQHHCSHKHTMFI